MAAKKASKKKASKKVAKKSTSKKPGRVTEIHVQKSGNNVLVKISNPGVLQSFIKSINHKVIAEEMMQMMEAQQLLGWLNAQAVPDLNNYKVTWNNDLYRVYNESYKAYSVIGSFGSGGRLNLGASQKRQEFKTLKPFGALYFSEELNTAVKEYSSDAPLGPKDIKYKVSLKKSFDLWDFDKIIDLLAAYPNLKESVRQTPVTAMWSDCKVPMQSQVISCWLRGLGGDGFIFESTKDPGKRNIVLIFKDDDDAKADMVFKKV